MLVIELEVWRVRLLVYAFLDGMRLSLDDWMVVLIIFLESLVIENFICEHSLGKLFSYFAVFYFILYYKF